MTQEPIYSASIYVAFMLLMALLCLVAGWMLFRNTKKEIKEWKTFCEQWKNEKDGKSSN